jgi:hypothetical protein
VKKILGESKEIPELFRLSLIPARCERILEALSAGLGALMRSSELLLAATRTATALHRCSKNREDRERQRKRRREKLCVCTYTLLVFMWTSTSFPLCGLLLQILQEEIQKKIICKYKTLLKDHLHIQTLSLSLSLC